VGDEEAVLGGGGELLGDAGVVEGDGTQGLGPGVLNAQVDRVAGRELEVVDGLDADEQVVGALGEAPHQLVGGAAREVGVLQGCGLGDGARSDAVEVLQVGADVGEAVLEGFDVPYAGDLQGGPDGGWDAGAGRFGDSDVGAVGQPGVDLGLLVIGGVE